MVTDTRSIEPIRAVESSDRRRTIAGVVLAIYMVLLSAGIVGGPLLLLAFTGVEVATAIKLTVLGVSIGYIPVILVALGGLPGT